MSILMWLVVGLVAGLLASLLVGGTGRGLLVDILIGIAGSVIGSWGFRELGWHAPFSGVAGVIFVAAVGAIALLLVLRLIAGGPRRTVV